MIQTPRLSAQQETVLVTPVEYGWVDGPDPGDESASTRWLITSQGANPIYLYELDDPRLAETFLEFAHLEQSEEAILEFVEMYGDLGFQTPYPGKNRRFANGEVLESWTLEIRAMRTAVDLATELSSRRRKRLQDWIKINEYGRLHLIREIPGLEFEWRFTPKLPVPRRVRPRELTRAARFMIADLINVRLRGRTLMEFAYDGRSEKIAQRFTPASLRTAMWFQFAQTVSIGKIAGCQACGKLMRLVPGVARSDKKTCSDVCRVKLSSSRTKKKTRNKKAAAKRKGKK